MTMDEVKTENGVRRENESLRLLQNIAIELLSHQEPEKMLQQILMHGTHVVGAPNGALYLLDEEDGQTMCVRFAVGALGSSLVGFKTKVTEGLMGKVWQTGQVQVQENYRNWDKRITDPLFDGVLTVIISPLRARGNMIGMLELSWNEEPFVLEKEVIAALQQFSMLASAALENAMLFQQLQAEIQEGKKIENTLRLSEERFRTIVTNTPIIIYVLDEQGVFTVSEGVGLKKIGLRPGEVVGQSALTIYQDDPDIIPALRRALAGETIFFEHAISDIYFDNRVVPLLDQEGRVKGVIGVALDITERKRAEEKLKHEKIFTNAVMDSVPGLLYLYDDQGKLIRWNKNHEVMTGYSATEMADMHLLDWFKTDHETQAHILSETSKASQGIFADAEADLQKKDGTTIPMHFTAIGMDIQGKSYITGIGIDITKRKQAEEALREANENLEDKVEARTQELTSVNEELTAMNEELIYMNDQRKLEIEERHRAEVELTQAIEDMKAMQGYLIQSEKMAALGGLVAGVAHEINTPIGVGVTAASHLKQITEDFMQTMSNRVLRRKDLLNYLTDLEQGSNIILKNMERASGLIQSFKQVAVDQSSETRRKFNVRRYLGEILLSMNPNIKKTRHIVTVECQEELVIDGYPGAFAQIITNLLMNSLCHAYGPEDGGNIIIRVGRVEDRIEIIYSDDGRGIDASTKPKIFDPFFTTTRGSGGTGLGLFVVYNIVAKKFGGSIQCNSEPGLGTTFHINLLLGGI